MRADRQPAYAETVEVDRIGIHVGVEVRRPRNRRRVRHIIRLQHAIDFQLQLRPAGRHTSARADGGPRHTVVIEHGLTRGANDYPVVVEIIEQIGEDNDRLPDGKVHSGTRTLEIREVSEGRDRQQADNRAQ